MIGRPKVPLVLTTPEQQALDSLAHRARTAPQVARRARIVLACARGLDNQTVAKKLRVSPQMVGRWRARFVTRRVDGLLDEPRPGAPRTITDDTVEAVIVRTFALQEESRGLIRECQGRRFTRLETGVRSDRRIDGSITPSASATSSGAAGGWLRWTGN